MPSKSSQGPNAHERFCDESHNLEPRRLDAVPLRVLVISQAPSQWQNPLFRFLAKENNLDLEVAFAIQAIPLDPELGRVPSWGEAGMTDGFSSTLVPSGRRDRAKWVISNATRKDLDIVVVPGWTIPLARLWLITVMMGRRNLRRTVVFTDSTDLTTRDGWRSRVRLVALKTLGRAGLHFGVPGTAARAHLMRCGIEGRQIVTLPYVVDNDAIAAEVSALRRRRDTLRSEVARINNSDAIVIVAVTKLIQRENPYRLVRSFLAIATDHPSAYLVLVGDGPCRGAIEELCRQPGGERVIFVGYQPYSSLPRFYAIADWFIHLPDGEPWGLSINEAIASGLPLLCSTSVGATQDLLEDGVNGILVGDGDNEAEAGLRRALDLPRPQLSQMGTASTQLSSRVHFRQWSDCLRSFQSQQNQSAHT
jgi:glycosyltransferase involved in cell wall biosynthesis